jgi:DNA-binding NtrC family response regulator
MSDKSIRLLIAEDEPKLRSVISRELARKGFDVTIAEDGDQATASLEKQEFDVLLLDVRMPGKDGLEVLAMARCIEPAPEAVMLTGNSTVEVAVEAMKLGACDFVTKPCSLDALDQILRKAAAKRELHRENAALKRRLPVERETGFVFGSAAMRSVEELIKRIAPSDKTVLIMGESGTGKELAAHAIHAASARASSPFVDVNCGAIPENLLESELFGYEKGAFTGAETSRPGLFELAHRGSLFLDEIGELPMGLQVKLLRVLETKSYYRVGGRRQIDSDVRIIAATNRDLAEAVEVGRFRKDLYFRINGLGMTLPTLRERPEGVSLLPRKIAPEAMALLRGFEWPGNVRELKNVIERAALVGRGDEIFPEDLPTEISQPDAVPIPPGITASGGSASPAVTGVTVPSLQDLEKQQILATLEQVHWHRGRAAKLLGISPKTLYRKIRSHGLK